MGKKAIDSVMQEKIKFIDDNSHVLINILNNRINNNYTVLETVTEMIINNRPLSEATNMGALKEFIELNSRFYTPRINDAVDSCGVIFHVASYINSCVSSFAIREEIRDRLRLYTSSFRNSGKFSKGYSPFIKVELSAVKELKKRNN